MASPIDVLPRTSLAEFLSTGFYSGKSPFAPGTVGTAVAAVIAILLFQFAPAVLLPRNSILLASAVTLVALIVTQLDLRSGRYGADASDPQQIVIDEFAGFFVALSGLGGGAAQILLAFLLFRLFDITKPPPIRQIEKLPGAWGIVLDDVLAGIFANFVGHAAASLIL
ncbi:MAG: phosphatidylglycerophosphatase A [Bdellovibrionales bacterium]|nr:phosphatidylglycerophosphatase A [Bdellovibrionales bacterium]